MSGTIERNYNMIDLEMLQLAQLFHNLLVTDKAHFVSAFPIFADPFAENFQIAIDAADAIPSGAEVDSNIAVITETLMLKMPTARSALQKLFSYSQFAFNSVAVTDAFGKNKYLKSRQSHIMLKGLLELAHRRANDAEYKPGLIAVGYQQSDIDELLTVAQQMGTLISDQRAAMAERWVTTGDRVSSYNSVWEFMRLINTASKVVFATSPAKLRAYLLYPNSNYVPKKKKIVDLEPKILHETAE